VSNTAAKVEHRVRLTDKATRALAKKTTTFEAVPPGQQETRISPTAISAGNFNTQARQALHAGIIKNCKPTPIAITPGSFQTSQKS